VWCIDLGIINWFIEWMKSLAQRYALIRQGVMLDNALNYFKNVPTSIDDIFGNIIQWVDRRLAEIVLVDKGSV
jgi:hypothetical protein